MEVGGVETDTMLMVELNTVEVLLDTTMVEMLLEVMDFTEDMLIKQVLGKVEAVVVGTEVVVEDTHQLITMVAVEVQDITHILQNMVFSQIINFQNI